LALGLQQPVRRQPALTQASQQQPQAEQQPVREQEQRQALEPPVRQQPPEEAEARPEERQPPRVQRQLAQAAGQRALPAASAPPEEPQQRADVPAAAAGQTEPRAASPPPFPEAVQPQPWDEPGSQRQSAPWPQSALTADAKQLPGVPAAPPQWAEPNGAAGRSCGAPDGKTAPEAPPIPPVERELPAGPAVGLPPADAEPGSRERPALPSACSPESPSARRPAWTHETDRSWAGCPAAPAIALSRHDRPNVIHAQ